MKASLTILTVVFAALQTTPLAGQSPADHQPMQVGEEIEMRFETAHPYVALRSSTPQLISSQEIHLPGATYVCPHFSRFDLAPGDYVIVRSPDGQRSWRYDGQGQGNTGKAEGFWGIHVSGERAVVELYSAGGQGYGYTIDRVARGFSNAFPAQPKAICGVDDSDWAKCYSASEPQIYEEARAVARLLIHGTGLCTGWLVGNEGHLFTNNHCISTAQQAANTNFEFMAEGDCGEFCGQLQCDGTIVTTSATLIKTNDPLDYTLLRLNTNPTATYGYIQLRETGPVVGERIYIPQHPRGEGKKITVVSTDAHDASGYPEIDAISNFVSGRMTGNYYGDTDGGSSGSPVLSYDDHCAVVLHSGAFGCSSLGNTGTVINQIIEDLGSDLPASALCASEDIFADGFESGTTNAW